MEKGLTGKVAIVTGASRGIGKAIAMWLAAHGADVVVAARTARKSASIAGDIESTAAEIRSRGAKAIALKTDVSDERSVANMVESTLSQLGRIDILVNNAATNSPALFQDISQNIWDRIMDVNLKGTVLCTKAVLPSLMSQRWGHILNISSVVTQTLHHSPFTGIAYDVTKAAINRFTLGLAGEMKPYNIAVNALMPGNTDSDGWAYLNPDIDRSSWDRTETWGYYAAVVVSKDPSVFTGNLLLKKELEALS